MLMNSHKISENSDILILATIPATSILIEALIPNKLTTVSFLEGIKDLNIVKYSFTATTLVPIYLDIVEKGLNNIIIDVSEYVYKAINNVIRNPFINTNTALGYLLLSIPLTYSIVRCSLMLDQIKLTNLDNVKNCVSKVTISLLRRSRAEAFYNALRMLRPSYSDRFVGVIPDINYVGNIKLSLFEVMRYSAYVDLLAKELIDGYTLTFITTKRLSSLCRDIDIKCLFNISKIHDELIVNALDSEGFKFRGLTYMRIIQDLVNEGFNSESVRERVKSLLRSEDLNLGTISDILANSITLYLVLRFIENVRRDHEASIRS